MWYCDVHANSSHNFSSPRRETPVHWSTRMLSAVSATTENARTVMSFCSVTCATWRYIRSATVCRTFLKASGCVVAVCSHPPGLWIVPSAPTREVPSSRQMIPDGPMSSVHYGSQRCVCVCFSFFLCVRVSLQIPVSVTNVYQFYNS